MLQQWRVGLVPGAMAVGLGLCIMLLSLRAFPPRVALVSCFLGWTMLAIAVIDARRFRIPDVLSLPAIPAGLLASGYLLDPASAHLVDLDRIVGACIGGTGLWLLREIYFRMRGREGLGLGDVKLAAAAGAWTGSDHLSYVLLLAAGLALATVIARAVVQGSGLSGSERIAFGCFLAPSIWVVWALRTFSESL
jgi:leader peptidase (prepilin peptidase)/N-methyltransferase